MDERRIAEAVREACVKAALAAWEDGGTSGLCAEGRFELVIGAIRRVDADAARRSVDAEGSGPRSPG